MSPIKIIGAKGRYCCVLFDDGTSRVWPLTESMPADVQTLIPEFNKRLSNDQDTPVPEGQSVAQVLLRIYDSEMSAAIEAYYAEELRAEDQAREDEIAREKAVSEPEAAAAQSEGEPQPS